MTKPQLTLNNSGQFRVLVNTKTGKFYRKKWNYKTDKFSDYSWTDHIRLCEHITGVDEERYLSSLRENCNLTEDVVFKTFQLQYVEIN
jgi:hypothetical protein